MSGLSRTPGKRVWVNSPPRVRIPPAPPTECCPAFCPSQNPHSIFDLRVFCCPPCAYSRQLSCIGRSRLGQCVFLTLQVALQLVFRG